MYENEKKENQTIEWLSSKNKILEEKLQKYQIIAKEANDAIFIADMEGNILETNTVAIKRYGYSAEEFLTMNIFDLRHEMCKELVLAQIEKANRESIVFETIHYLKDNTAINVEVSSKGMLIGKKKAIISIVRDITERKRMEEKLRDSEIKYRTLFDTSEGAVLLFTDGCWVDCNAKALFIFGCTREQIIGEHPVKFSPLEQPDGRSSAEEAVKLLNLAYAGKPQLFEWVHCRADESLFAAEVSLKRLDIGGKPYIQSIVRDVTERTMGKNALFQSQVLNSAIVESTSDLIWSVDSEHFRILSFNNGVKDYLLKRGINLAIGKKPEDFNINTEICNRWYALYQRALAEGAYNMEYQDAEGNTHIALTFETLRLDDQVFGISVFGKNITEQKKAESELQKSKEKFQQALKEDTVRFQSLIESTNDWIWISEPENYELIVFNSTVAKYFKENHNLILKKGMRPEEVLSEKRMEQWKGYYEKVISEGKFIVDYYTDAKKIHLILTLSRLDVDGLTIGVSVIGKDVTKEMQYKEQLEERNKSLLRMLQQSINTISRIGELRDVYTAGHQKRVAELSCEIARQMGLTEKEINNISLGALIHDIGKIYVPTDILNKPGKITNLEYQIIQTHAQMGYEVIKEIDFPLEIKTMIHQHHEFLDGSGYPQQLSGDQIILESRILTVADVVEAMTSHRPYRPALGIDLALEEIQMFKGSRYDPDVVDVCVKLLRDENFQFE